MKKLFAPPFLAILMFSLGGCTESPSDPLSDQAATPVVQRVASMSAPEAVYDEATGLWITHRNDPYTLENFQQAYDNLLSGSARSLSAVQADELAGIELQATHYSVKIYPKTEEEQWQLEQTEDVKIVYVPLDYVQLPEEETSGMSRSSSAVIPDQRRYTVTYDDLETTEGFKHSETITLPVLYAVWPCCKPFPADLDYEIQYEVFLPEYPSGATRSAMPASEALRMLEQEAITLAVGNPSAMTRIIIDNPSTDKVVVSGSFKYYDNLLRKDVPLQNLLVKLQFGANILVASTDATGVYSFNVSTSMSAMLAFVSTTFSNTKWKITAPDSSSPITTSWGIMNKVDLNFTIRNPAGNEYNIHRAVNFYFNGKHDIPKAEYTYGCKIVANPGGHAEYGGLFHYFNKDRDNTAYLEIFTHVYNDNLTIGVVFHELGHYTQYCRRGGTANFGKIAKFLIESYADYTGWSLCNSYYTSLGWKTPYPANDITGCARQDWPLSDRVQVKYNPLLIDLVDNYNQPTIKGTETVDDRISDVPTRVIERIALEANDWATCKSILREYADTYYTPPAIIGGPSIIIPYRRMYYSTDELNSMLPQYDLRF